MTGKPKLDNLVALLPCGLSLFQNVKNLFTLHPSRFWVLPLRHEASWQNKETPIARAARTKLNLRGVPGGT